MYCKLFNMKNGIVCFSIFMTTIACDRIKGSDDAITGLWELYIIEVQDSVSGRWHQADWMKNGSGYLHYDGSQYMSAHFLPEGYNDVEAFENTGTSSADYWYLAKYSMNEQSGVLMHQRFLHSDPAQKNLSVKRRYEFHGDTLFLFADEFNFRLKWVRP